MKTEFTDVSETRKSLAVEIPTSDVDRQIVRLSKQYGKSVKVPGFRPGKVPAAVARRRFRDQILRDVAQDLVPQAVDEALRERGLEPVDTPSVRDVKVEEGEPLTFTATFETLPPIDPGEYRGLTLRRAPVEVDDAAVDRALEQVRERAAKMMPVEGRPVAHGDTVMIDLERQPLPAQGPPGATERHEGVALEVGGPANPPGFDDELVGLDAGAEHAFTLTYPTDHEVAELAGRQVRYTVTIKDIRVRVLPDLDDDLAKDLGECDSLDALRTRVREDLVAAGERDSEQEMRADLLKQLASRVAIDVPEALVTRDLDRRLEHFVGHLLAQRIDPREANVDWAQMRDEQRPAATDTVRSTLMLDEIVRREAIEVTDAEIEAEIARQAKQSGRTVAAMRALIEKEGGLDQVATALRREQAIAFLVEHATVVAV